MSNCQEQAAFWRAAIELHEHSGQSIRGFCRAEGLKEHLFYRWRKQLGLSPTRERSRRAQPPAIPEPPTAAQFSSAIPPSAKGASTSPSTFVPIKVHSLEHSSTYPIQVRLPNGVELTVCGTDLPRLLSDLLQAC